MLSPQNSGKRVTKRPLKDMTNLLHLPVEYKIDCSPSRQAPTGQKQSLDVSREPEATHQCGIGEIHYNPSGKVIQSNGLQFNAKLALR